MDDSVCGLGWWWMVGGVVGQDCTRARRFRPLSSIPPHPPPLLVHRHSTSVTIYRLLHPSATNSVLARSLSLSLAVNPQVLKIPIICKVTKGILDLSVGEIYCHCNTCRKERVETGLDVSFTPTDFERHAGSGQPTRRWRYNLKVNIDVPTSDGELECLGAYLDRYNINFNAVSRGQVGK